MASISEKNNKLIIDKLEPVLGVFQKLNGLSKQDHFGFELLCLLVDYIPMDPLSKYMTEIFKLIFGRLSTKKTPKYIKGLLVFVCFFISKRGLGTVISSVETVQPGIFNMLLEKVWVPDILSVYEDADRKTVILGMAIMLFQSPQILQQYIKLWPKLVEAAVSLMSDQLQRKKPEAPPDDEDAEDNKGLSAAFAKLAYAPVSVVDLFPTVKDPTEQFLRALQGSNQQHQGKIAQLIGQTTAKTQEDLKRLLGHHKISI